MLEKSSKCSKYSDKDVEIYNRFLKLIKAVRSSQDVKFITDIYTSKIDNPDLIEIMDSVSTFGNPNILGVEEFIDVIESLEKFIYRDDAREFVQMIFKRTDDFVQRSTIIRLMGYKPPKMQRITMKQFNEKKDKKNNINKMCPHCQKITEGTPETTYIICGYSDKGYDWDGCQKDWCFRCGKKLCKNFFKDSLFNENNRFHTNLCCKLHAYKNKENYNKQYCTCDKIYINHRV